MKYALINGLKVQAAIGAKGYCPSCGKELIAKCGERKINHWAHKGTRICDSWWEPETEWHRSWKNKFPHNWQETSFIDEQTNEKHIADVLTNQGLVIEFQHGNSKLINGGLINFTVIIFTSNPLATASHSYDSTIIFLHIIS